ncbi:transglutaminase-like cysteine peptidase [Roseovarius albus]|nr:transglutaminase-like cysteine peptidase [Roseovarius albus]
MLCVSLAFAGLGGEANAGGNNGLFLAPKRASVAPDGFSGVCARYPWACARSNKSQLSSEVILKLAKRVNTQVNRQTKEIEDQDQYGKEEYWALPTTRGGDCEDFALSKKMRLMSHGVSSDRLLIATVLDRDLNSHAVLVLRTDRGDLVLDNLTSKIVSWRSTGYTFLKLQNPKAKHKWQAVLAGGVIKN